MPDHRDASTLQRKLQLLDAYLDELAPLVLDGRAPAGNVRRRAAERLVQLVVEATIDVNGLVLAARRHHPPASARDSFVAVRDAGLLPRELADRFLASLPAPPEAREKRVPYRGRAGRPESKRTGATPSRKPTTNNRRKPTTNNHRPSQLRTANSQQH